MTETIFRPTMDGVAMTHASDDRDDREAQARQYIDRVVAVNREHGSPTVSRAVQKDLVKQAADAFSKIRPAE